MVEWAAQNGYVLVTHDRGTMLKTVHERLRAAQETAGVVIVRSGFPLYAVVEDMVMSPKGERAVILIGGLWAGVCDS